jgi:anti-anti-sigma factor
MKQYTLPTTPSDRTQSQYVCIDRHSRGLFARILCPSIGQREAPIIAAEIMAAIDGCAHSKVSSIVIDFAGVQQISSMGLGMCVDIRNRAAGAKMKGYLVGTSRTVLDLLRMMKVEKLYTVLHGSDDMSRILG